MDRHGCHALSDTQQAASVRFGTVEFRYDFGTLVQLERRSSPIGTLLKQSFNTVRERLRDIYREAGAKAGNQREEIDVNVCWSPWLTWVLDDWEGNQWAIALDATSLGDRFVVLAVSVLYRDCAVPAAWKVLKAQRKHAWKPE